MIEVVDSNQGKDYGGTMKRLTAAALVLLVLLIIKRKNTMNSKSTTSTDNGRKTAAGLVNYAKAQLGRPYWWGTSGQIATETLLNSMKKLYPSQYNTALYENAPQQLGQKVHDCMGLIEGYFWSETPDSPAKYNSNGFTDTTADRLYAAATEKGDISTIPEIPGLAVHTNGHIGVYIGNGQVIDAYGHAKGVIQSPLKRTNKPWKHWLKIPGLEY